MMCTKNMYLYCTQLVSTTDAFHHVSDGHVHPLIESGGPMPRALSDIHATDAVLSSRPGDGCARERSRFDEQDVRGLIPRNSL
jgi:hypothetical protein